MILRTALAAVTTVLLTSAALATPVLKSETVVTNSVVTLGDLFDEAGLAAEEALFRSPLPGTTGTVKLNDVRSALARIGITQFDANGLDGIRVSRAASVVDEKVLSDLIAADLSARGILSKGMSINTMFNGAVRPVNAEASAQPAHVVNLRYLPGAGTFSARFAIDGIEQPLDVSGTIEMMIEAPHIAGTLAAGTVLGGDNIVMRPVPLKYVESTGVARLEDVLGKALVRQSREGMMLKPSDVAAPLMVSKNDVVTIYFRNGPMTLTVKGQAITGAAEGGPLQVLNLMSKRVVSATAIAAGAVEVSANPLAVAGL